MWTYKGPSCDLVMGDVVIQNTVAATHGWRTSGKIPFSVTMYDAEGVPPRTMTITIDFVDAESTQAAQRQALQKLHAIATHFLTLATKGLAELPR